MARTKKNKPGGARRHKEAAPERTPAQVTTDGQPDGERPAKKARLEKGIGHSRTPSKPGNTSHDAVQEPGKRHDKKAGIEGRPGFTSAVPTKPEPKRKPIRRAKQSRVSLPPQPPQAATPAERPNARTSFISSLSNTHDVISFSVMSSSSIQKKVTTVLSHLSSQSTAKRPLLAVLTAKAGVASKAITIAEISKREIEKDGGKWFQYSGVEGVLGEWTPKDRGTKSKGEEIGGNVEDGTKTTVSENPAEEVAKVTQESVDRRNDVEEDEEEEEGVFETMRDPPANDQGTQEGPSIAEYELRRKVRAVPVLTIFLSRTRVGELKKQYG
ncbi:MAG: hypothetical protein M1813_009428 [Trichoglossum hirsutum]|nr:MAG: hypothetical protein M1813_009428 [Trichoglossum hirsutum]